ncbi:unnamed protein product [Arabidopsis lyrata]|nr:unnamed protein product [Arabidopsis lyrata]
MESTVLNSLVGMEAHMVKMNLIFNMGSENQVLFIGIWGMGGIGKTTIANCLYDRFSSQFSARYFIEDIKNICKDKSPAYLQERFLSRICGGLDIGFRSHEARSQEIIARLGHQKILIVLDGVDKAEQVDALAKDTSWFGPGSRIIITTRDRGLLNSCGVNNVYEVKCLDDKDALQVFKISALRGSPPPSDGFEQLFIRASRLAHGLPSALVTYATYLRQNTTIKKWEEELGLLETSPHKNVKEILRNSYDDLDEQDKTAFLYVACLLNGYPFNHVTSLLDDGRPRMNHLTAKALISISMDGCINMHFLVVQTGKAIVRQESRNRPSRQRFLWDHKEIYDVLDNNIGTDEIEGVTLHMCEMPDKLPMSITVFNIMHSIKFLKFFKHLGDAESNVQLSEDGFYFPRNIRLLHWDDYPMKTLPSTRSDTTTLSNSISNGATSRASGIARWKLRRLDLTGSKNLRELPDLSTAVNFEELIIQGCKRLRNIPESIRRLHTLKKLNAIDCFLRGVEFSVELSNNYICGGSSGTSLSFPKNAMMFPFLKNLSIEGKLYIELLGLNGKTEHLSFGSKQQIPDQSMTIEEEPGMPQLMSDSNSSKSLEIKQFSYNENRAPFRCSNFQNVPCLTELKLINLNIHYISKDISHLQFLETLDLEGNDVKYLPQTLGQLPKLKYLSLRNCRQLRELPQLTQVETLILSDSVNLSWLLDELDTYCLLELWLDNCKDVHDIMTVPSSIRELLSLETLCLNNCKRLISVEELPLSLKHLYAHGCDSLETVSLSPNHSIKHFDLGHCPRLNQEEHKHLMDLFLYDGHSQEDSRRCVCLPETGMRSHIDDEVPETCTRISLPQKWVTEAGNFFRFFISCFRS